MLVKLYNPVPDEGEPLEQKSVCLASLAESLLEFAPRSTDADGLFRFDLPDMELTRTCLLLTCSRR